MILGEGYASLIAEKSGVIVRETLPTENKLSSASRRLMTIRCSQNTVVRFFISCATKPENEEEVGGYWAKAFVRRGASARVVEYTVQRRDRTLDFGMCFYERCIFC
jgi:hypothetical protein